MQTVKVIARRGVRVPLENSSREYITADGAVEIVMSAYYRRRLNDGDLQRAPVTPVKPAQTGSDEPVLQRTADTHKES